MQNYKNKIVLIRSYASGVHFGTLESATEDKAGSFTVTLKNTRRIHYWEGAASLSQIAMDGVKSGRITLEVPEIIVAQCIEIIPMSELSITNLQNQPVWKM